MKFVLNFSILHTKFNQGALGYLVGYGTPVSGPEVAEATL
jgi:hypothetical protein